MMSSTEYKMAKGHNKFTLDLSTVAQGMYVLRVKNGVKEHNQKFVKE